MKRQTLENGFEVWRDEVTEMDWCRDNSSVPYVALVPLVGIYRALYPNGNEATSYYWRQTVLRSPSAMQGLKHNLGLHATDLDDPYSMPIAELLSDDYTSLQHKKQQESIVDGVPLTVKTIAWNELLLAQNLGQLVHDDGATLKPLQLTDQGEYSLRGHFPVTADYLDSIR